MSADFATYEASRALPQLKIGRPSGDFHRNGLAIRRVIGNLSLSPRRCQSNAEIGLILEITTATVGKHLERIYPKLGVENRTAAASFASELAATLES